MPIACKQAAPPRFGPCARGVARRFCLLDFSLKMRAGEDGVLRRLVSVEGCIFRIKVLHMSEELCARNVVWD